jgi:hypothetical protein
LEEEDLLSGLRDLRSDSITFFGVILKTRFTYFNRPATTKQLKEKIQDAMKATHPEKMFVGSSKNG